MIGGHTGERIAFADLVGTVSGLPAPAIVAIDGWSGSGKTWTASHLVAQLGLTGIGWTVVHMDDFVPGWHGLRTGIDVVRDQIVAPLAAGKTARARQWDWHTGQPGHDLEFSPVASVILEGSGAIAAAGEHASLTVWIDVDESRRLRRLRRRSDFDAYEPFMSQWAKQERAVETEFGSIQRADLVISDVGRDGLVLQVDAKNSS